MGDLEAVTGLHWWTGKIEFWCFCRIEDLDLQCLVVHTKAQNHVVQLYAGEDRYYDLGKVCREVIHDVWRMMLDEQAGP
jgi:hypothetical protein